MSPIDPRWQVRHRLDTPLGAMSAVATAAGLAGLWFDGQAHHPGDLGGLPAQPELPLFQALEQQLAQYWASPAGSERHATAVDPLTADFDLPLDPTGTDFQCRVWAALRAIPRGATTRYGDIATQLGQPSASRAVGAAVGRNPVSILVPCHRVIGRDGSLTGYAGGLDRKTALLRLEGALPKSLI